MRAAALLLLLLAAAAALLPPAAAAPVPPKKKGKVVGGPTVRAHKEDVKYIKCQVCELLAKNAWKQVKEMQKAANASHPVDELMIIEKMEKITTAWRPEGEWIAKLDLVEDGDKLVVKEMEQVGNCLDECKTVQLAAEQIMGEHDTDMAEMLFTGKKNRAQFNNWLCYELSEVCKAKPPPLPKDRAPGLPFEPRQEGDQNVDAMLGGLADQGLHGNKLRDQLLEKLGVTAEQEPDEDDMSPEAMLKRAMKQMEEQDAAKKAAGAAAAAAEKAEDGDDDDEDWEEVKEL